MPPGKLAFSLVFRSGHDHREVCAFHESDRMMGMPHTKGGASHLECNFDRLYDCVAARVPAFGYAGVHQYDA